MSSARRCLFAIIFTIALYPCFIAPASAAGVFTFQAIAPGSTMTIDMEQTAAFPLGCPQLFLVTAGSGTLNITLQKTDITDDYIFMLGIAASGSGNAYIGRVGVSKGQITQSVSIGSESKPGGLVWLYSGVFFSAIAPKYTYTVRLAYQPR